MKYVTPRSLSDAEAAVLYAAVERASVGAGLPEVDLVRFLADARVYAICECGCASLSFVPQEAEIPTDTHLVADAMAYRSTNTTEWVGILIYASSSGLVDLELHTPFDEPAMLPPPSAVQAWPIDL